MQSYTMFLFVQNACRDVLTGFANLSTSIFVSPQGVDGWVGGGGGGR